MHTAVVPNFLQAMVESPANVSTTQVTSWEGATGFPPNGMDSSFRSGGRYAQPQATPDGFIQLAYCYNGAGPFPLIATSPPGSMSTPTLNATTSSLDPGATSIAASPLVQFLVQQPQHQAWGQRQLEATTAVFPGAMTTTPVLPGATQTTAPSPSGCCGRNVCTSIPCESIAARSHFRSNSHTISMQVSDRGGAGPL
jgi:hypothetical protein